jgi:hypothetical protein
MAPGLNPKEAGDMKAWYVDRVHEKTTCTCGHCGHPLAWVDTVGWVDKASDTYDMCEVDAYGNHQPTPASQRPRA